MVSDDTGDTESAEAVRALFARTPDGPPMRVDASDVIVRGATVRRRRKRLAVAGSSAATVAVLVVAGLAVGRGTAPPPVMPAGPGLATVSPAPSGPVAPEKVPPSQRQVPTPDPKVSPGSPDKEAPTEPTGPRAGTSRPGSPPRAYPTTNERAPVSVGSPAGSTSLPSPTTR